MGPMVSAEIKLTPLQRMKLEHFEKAIGPLSSTEALTLAIEAEQITKACGPFDPAYAVIKQQQLHMEQYAELLEAAGK